uniref:Uncharacterized protein n=1 Tax=viral metagenome TaxID=1070528 RepID=A0A6C0LXP8_9ZZZZ
MTTPSSYCKAHGIDTKQKWIISVMSGLLFLIFTLPITYDLTDGLARIVGSRTTRYGGPTLVGIALHTVVFALVVRVMMW